MTPQKSRTFTLPQLAEAAAMTVRNVRSYQTRGLIPPPVRRGRHSIYDSRHLERLREIHQARERGASLNLIAGYLSDGGSLATGLDRAWLPSRGALSRRGGRTAEPAPPRTATASLETILSRVDVADPARFDKTLDDLARAGVVRRSRGRLMAERPFVTMVAGLVKHGVPVERALEVAAAAAEAGQKVRAAAGDALDGMADDDRTRGDVLSLATGVFASVVVLDLTTAENRATRDR
ncbi:MAG: MerR family transcriptional regulator [Kineosporiaceae bacterium]|nr:MerR family transcriptional regulator [Kineosporiaceae bacterium]